MPRRWGRTREDLKDSMLLRLCQQYNQVPLKERTSGVRQEFLHGIIQVRSWYRRPAQTITTDADVITEEEVTDIALD